MPHLKKPPPGANNYAFSVQQPDFGSGDSESTRSSRVSLEVFGGGSQVSPLLFSRTRSAWKDALQSAESRLQSTSNASREQETINLVASTSDTSVPSSQQQVTDYATDISTAVASGRAGFEDDVSKWLADAENPGGLVKGSSSSASRSLDYGGDCLDSNYLNHDACTQKSSECSVEPGKTSAEQEWGEVLQLKRGKNVSGGPEVADEALSVRAAQWGYGVVLKPSDNRGSGSAGSERLSGLSWTTGRSDTSSGAGKSSRTTSEESSAGSGFSSGIPGISKNVKEALASFQLAFVVCDALHTDYPILYASAGFFSMTGYSAKEVVGRNCRFLQGEYTDAQDIFKIREALREGNIYTGKLLNYKKDGSPFWNMLTISPIKDDAGRLIKYIGMQAEVTEVGISGKDGDPNAFPAGLKKLVEAQGKNGTNYNSANGGVLQTTSAPRKSSMDKSSPQGSNRPRYSLSSSRQSSEASSNVGSTQDYQAAAKLKAEVAALRAGSVGNGEPQQVPRGDSGCKSSKRTLGLIKMFKKLNGRFSLTKRGSRECNDEDRFVMDDHYDLASDPDDEDLDSSDRKQRRSSVYTSTLTGAGKQELDRSSETLRSRRNSNQSCRSEERHERTSTADNLEKNDTNSEGLTRKERSGGRCLTPGLDVPELPKSAIGYGRRSAQYPVLEGRAGLQGQGLATDRKDRRHSVTTFTSAGSGLNLDGKSQFCIVHP